MSAVTKGTLHPCTPPGYEKNDKAQAASALATGDLLVITAATAGNGFEYVVTVAPAGTINADGIALKPAVAGGVASVGLDGEMDGFTGLTPRTLLYPSGSVAGGLDTTATTFAATTPAVAAQANVKAITPTRIRYLFL